MTDKSLVVQHNKIIEARYKLSVGEQRLIKLLVSMIESDDEDFKKYRIYVADLAALLDIKRKDFYAAVRLATKKLIGNVLTFEIDGEIFQAAWLASAHYQKGNGVVDLQFAPLLKPFLLQLKSHFTAYELGNVIRLKHTYSIRVYELLKQYEKIGKRRFTIDKLREVLMLDDGQYKLYKDFKKNVLITAQEELEEKTDISFEIIEERKWKTCVAIEFIIKSQKRKQSSLKLEEPPELKSSETADEKLGNAVIAQLVSLGVARKVAGELAGEYDEGRILAGIAYTLAQQKEGKVKSAGGFVVEAIKNEYRDSKTEERQRKEEAAKAEAAEKARLKAWERIKEQWGAWRVERTQAHIDAMDAETLEREKAAFRASLVDNPALANLVKKKAETEARHFRIYVTGRMDGLNLAEWARAVGVDLSPFEELARRDGKL